MFIVYLFGIWSGSFALYKNNRLHFFYMLKDVFFLVGFVHFITSNVEFENSVFFNLYFNSMQVISIIFFLFSVFLLTFKINSIKNFCRIYKPHIYIALFLLCETTLILCLIILRTIFLHNQTNFLSTVLVHLTMFTLIMYMAMNISNHLRLIYWEIRKVRSLNILYQFCRMRILNTPLFRMMKNHYGQLQ